MSAIPPLTKPSRTTRSRITNGSTLHLGYVDGRTEAARRFRDVLSEIASDLGGSESLSEAQRQLARRASMMSVQCETLEAKSIAGEEIDLDLYGALSDRIGRAFTRLGIKREKRRTLNPILDHFSQPPERARP